MIRTRLILFAVWLGLAACSVSSTRPSASGDGTETLHALFDEYWDYYLSQYPNTASYIGDARFNDRWSDVRPEAYAARDEKYREFLGRLDDIDRGALAALDRDNYDLFRRSLESNLEGFAGDDHLLSVNQRDGAHVGYNSVNYMSFETEQDYRNWLARLNAFDDYVDWNIALLRAGVAKGFTQPEVIVDQIVEQVKAQQAGSPQESDYFKPFRDMPERIPAAVQDELRRAGLNAVRETVRPAYARLERFLLKEYRPAARPAVGAWSMPDGREYYARQARQYTTTDLTPAEIHDIGLAEVKRIRAQMEDIIRQVGFKGSFQEFLAFLRSDPQFHYKDPEELLKAYRATAKRIDPELVKLFHVIPRTPYGVIPIPDAIAPYTYTAYYSGPAADGSRPGYYNVNLYRPEVRPIYEIEALTVHEAVPGHHFQIARAMELGELPDFRRYGESYTAFVEGWALYAESLGDSIGLYQDPYSKFGQLTYEMWRAVRLVVDTGMHDKSWTRQQAVDFFMANAAKSEKDINNEIDRYISWPGQALAYKIGELKIKELRRRAETALGENFDLKAFHDHLLGAGSLPLDLLEQRMDSWIEAQTQKTVH